MKIKMLKTENGSPNGLAVNKYEAGEEYNTTESLAKSFVRAGCAEYVKEGAKPVATKADEQPVEENKADNPVKDNKSNKGKGRK